MTTTLDRTPDARRAGSERHRGPPAHRLHRRRAAQRQPRRRRARRRGLRRDQGPAAPAQGPVLPRPGHQPRRPRRRSPSGSARSRTTRSPGSDPDHPGLVRIYKDLDSPAEHYENAFHCDATWREAPPMGSVLRCVEGPAVGGDTIWVNMVEAYSRLPEHVKAQIAGLRARHSIEATFGAAMPIEQRHALRSGSPTPSTRSCAPTRRPARRSCSSTRSPPTSPTSTPPRTSASASTTRPAAASCSTT